MNVSRRSVRAQGALNQHLSPVTDESGNLVLRKFRQVISRADVVNRRRQILFGIHQGSIEVENQDRGHA
jgi:hypothetical protein